MADIPITPGDAGTIVYSELAGRLRAERSGSNVSYTPVSAGGDAYLNDGAVQLLILNTGASAWKVERRAVASPGEPQVTPDDVVVCDPGEVTIAPPVHPLWFNDATGKVQLRYPAGSAPDLSIVALRSADVR